MAGLSISYGQPYCHTLLQQWIAWLVLSARLPLFWSLVCFWGHVQVDFLVSWTVYH